MEARTYEPKPLIGFDPGNKGILIPAERVAGVADRMPFLRVVTQLTPIHLRYHRGIRTDGSFSFISFGSEIAVLSPEMNILEVTQGKSVRGILIRDLETQEVLILSPAFYHLVGPLIRTGYHSTDLEISRLVRRADPYIVLLEGLGYDLKILVEDKQEQARIGIGISRAVRRKILEDYRSGSRLATRVLSGLLLNNELLPPHLPVILTNILETLLSIRREREVYGPAFTSVELVNETAQVLGFSTSILRSLYLAMRADYVMQAVSSDRPYSSGLNQGEFLRELWRETLSQLFTDHENHIAAAPIYIRIADFNDLMQRALAARDPILFYRELTALKGTRRTFGTLVPREVEFLTFFYSELRHQAISGAPISIMGRFILQATRDNWTNLAIAKEIYKLSGVKIGKSGVSVYRKFLLLGIQAL
ncbi:MAG: hypothetical protein PHS44_07145 [Candidatus Dojkabacteria bacterium]|nr:hypothetical protein [Candidatus Dojkabacteria bacterium]